MAGLKITKALEGVLRGDEFKILGVKKNPSLQIGKFVNSKVRFNKDGSLDVMRVNPARKRTKKRRRNISEGFYADGVFHPIRSASDYDGSRAGEGTRKRKPAKKKKAKAAKKRKTAKRKR